MPVTVKTSAGTKEYPYKLPEHIQLPFIESVVGELTGFTKSASDVQSAARTNNVMEKVLSDYYK